MMVETANMQEPVYNLNKAFLLNFPTEAARQIETLPPEETAEMIEDQPIHVIVRVFEKLAPGSADHLLMQLPEDVAGQLLGALDPGQSAIILSRLNETKRDHFLHLTEKGIAAELKTLLEYPENTAGQHMNTGIIAFNENSTVEEAIAQIKRQKVESLHHLFLLNDDMRLHGHVDIQRLALAEGNEKLKTLSTPIVTYVHTLDPKEDVVQKLEKFQVDSIPVVDLDHRLVGIIEGKNLIDAVREDMASSMQTMVGASKDERALSSSLFAVKKRLPWLQINLLTAFMAAAVVGMFEDTIAKYTALAILLPIAAGQSGNAGAQALAVTMRGLTLREITMRHWFSVMRKEFGTGLLNGIGIAVTCSAGIYLWSQSVGLALVMALSMIISMTIAGVSGALVPIVLKRFGLDPAQSSSIVLTTVTDIAGFMSFLGIATLLSSMLDPG